MDRTQDRTEKTTRQEGKMPRVIGQNTRQATKRRSCKRIRGMEGKGIVAVDLLVHKWRRITRIHSCWSKHLWLYLQKDLIFVGWLGVMIVCARLQMHQRTCRLQGCEQKWFTNLAEFFEHYDAVHEVIVCVSCICFRKKSGSFLAACSKLHCKTFLNFR